MGEKLDISKNAKLQISGIGNCKIASSDIGKSQNCEHAKLKIRKLEIANLQIRKFGNLQNCEYAKFKIQKLQIANLEKQNQKFDAKPESAMLCDFGAVTVS